MQVTSLPKELQTQKVTSLPKELRSVADELIAEKFGVKEEPPKKRDPFHDARGYGEPSGTGYANGYGAHVDDRYRGHGGVEVYRSFQTGRDMARVVIKGASIESIYDAMRKLDMKNCRRENRCIHASIGWMRYILANDIDFDRYFERANYIQNGPGVMHVYGRIMGMDIISISEGMETYITAQL